MLGPEDLDCLACPDCSGTVLRQSHVRSDRGEVVEGSLACPRCGAVYEIADGVPCLLPAALKGIRRRGIESSHEDWRSWGERLLGFLEWREQTWERGPAERRRRDEIVAERRRDSFVVFCGALEGRVLEVGCGSGSLGRAPGFRAGAYWGLDPVPPEDAARDIRLVAGVGERLPFRSGIFEAVIVKESLHHFQSPAGFLDEARRVTAPRGCLLVCQGVEVPGDRAGLIGSARLLVRRAGTALGLLAAGRLRELRRRTGRLLDREAGRGPVAPEGAPYLWRLTREDIESEVKRRFVVEETRMDGNCLYLRARA